jgi:hypothetical protein
MHWNLQPHWPCANSGAATGAALDVFRSSPVLGIYRVRKGLVLMSRRGKRSWVVVSGEDPQCEILAKFVTLASDNKRHRLP